MLRTIYIMWLRELKRFLRSRSRIIGALGQPILYLFALGYGLGSVFHGSYVDFLVPGIISMAVIFASIFNGMQVIWDRQFGFLKETLVAPVPRIAVMLGRTFGGATVATAQASLVLVVRLAPTFGQGCLPILRYVCDRPVSSVERLSYGS